ncbi:Hypothetical predicted protein [Mytilus galloprovincialis]|uniref:Uncharacterized protein n=1 Tax=Mytilus galloprovincialis TaxID=29158 RepID=A0A8B6CUY6_MYTGA|nr:Hypothetical predicted protein [Mytilus galloprovincialis]
MTDDTSRHQVFLLGAGSVGKTSILNQYMKGNFTEIYTETVENIQTQPYSVNGNIKYVDFIDTAGSIAFPAMRQIYISKANGFILVYAIDDAYSFREVVRIWEQIKCVRKNVLSIPCVVVGNKIDNDNKMQIETFDALEWAFNQNLGGCFLEVSTKEGGNVKDIFDILLEQFGNTRALQTGRFTIRSTSLSRKPVEDEGFRLKLRKKRFDKMVAYDKVVSSTKMFQQVAFTGYKKNTIYRLKPEPKLRPNNALTRKKSFGKNDEKLSNVRSTSVPTGNEKIPATRQLARKSMEDLYSYKTTRYEQGSNENESKTKINGNTGLFAKVRKYFRRSST